MESPEKANMRLAQEYNTAERNIHERSNAMHMIAEMFGCDIFDVETMLRLLRTHGVYEICEAVEDFTEDTSLKWSFGTIVIAAKNVVWRKLHFKIDETLHQKLKDVAVSTQPSIYGTAIKDIEGLDETTLMAFSDMIKYGTSRGRINALTRAYAAQGGKNAERSE
jgi:hypothetical protein